ncbi:MAG: hypothetical protein RLY71_3211 [Pseudomonadota bacterium]
MATSVFISYAAKDPDWPLEMVTGLAEMLRQRGASVRFDRFYRKQLGRKPSDDEWMRWMRAGVKASDKIVCLCSPRYLEASDRHVADPSGYGVAFEAQKLIHQLYQSKGFNEGRISCVLREGRSRESSVPEDLRSDCARYAWPAEQTDLLDDLTGVRSESVEGPSVSPNTGSGRKQGSGGEDGTSGSTTFARRQEDFTRHALDAAPAFMQSLQADLRSRSPSKSWFQAEPVTFVHGLARADKQVAHQLMWAVRRVLKVRPRPIDEPTRKAAIALYMLCACRWTQPAVLRSHSGRVIHVPPMLLNPIAVLSAALLGGGLTLESNKQGDPCAAHAYEVKPAPGEDPSVQLLRAIYVALCSDDDQTPAVGRHDSANEAEVERMLSAIRVRINRIQQVDESQLTLVIDCPEIFDEASWASRLNIKAFACGKKIVEEILVIDPVELEGEIKELWKEICRDERTRSDAAAADAGKATTQETSMNQGTPPGTTNITITANGSQFAVATGNAASASNKVSQFRQGADVTELLPLLTELHTEIARLAAAQSMRESLNKQVEDVEQVVQTRPAEARSLIQKGLDNIKLLAGAAEGADRLLGAVGKVAEAVNKLF